MISPLHFPCRMTFLRWIAKAGLSLHLLVLAGGASAEVSPRPRALFEPEPGRTLLVIGQDLGSIGGLASPCNKGYSDHVSPVPGGVTTYIPLPSLAGMTTAVDYGAGKVNARAILDSATFKNSVLAIGLYMVGQEAAIAAGTHDAQIVTLAKWIKRADRPVYLRIGYEFDGSWNHYDPTNFKLAWKRIVDILRQQKVTNCATVWQSCTSSFSSFKNRDLLEWYPGDDYVDWFGCSWFIQSDEQIQLTDRLVDLARAHGKPVMVCESAPQGYDTKNLTKRDIIGGGHSVDKTAQQIWSEWYIGFFSYIQKNSDSIRIVAYINANWDAQSMWGPPYASGYWGDSRVENNAEIKSLWLQAIRGSGWLHASPGLFQHLTTGLDATLSGAP